MKQNYFKKGVKDGKPMSLNQLLKVKSENNY